MAQILIVNKQDGALVRDSLNTMFAELYAGVGGGITTYNTLVGAKAATGTDNNTIVCVETETFYRYEETGSALTANDTSVLTTGDGGDTRWKGISGKYTHDTIYPNAISLGGQEINDIVTTIRAVGSALDTAGASELAIRTQLDSLTASGADPDVGTFDSTDLTAGILTKTHNFSVNGTTQFVDAAIYNASKQRQYTYSYYPTLGSLTSSIDIDLSMLVPEIGSDTWFYKISYGAGPQGNPGSDALVTAENVNSAGAVMETDYNANTIITANTDDTPTPLTIAEQRIVGRITGGNIIGLTPVEIRTLINVADGATAGGGITTYADVATAEAANGSNTELCYVVTTKTLYEYIAAGSAYTEDNLFVLPTGDAGDTRWLAVAGKYVYDTANFRSVVMAISSPRTAANTGRAITSADFGKNLVVTDGSDQTFSLPSVGSGDDGKWFYMTKKGAGNIILGRADTDTIGADADTSITMTTVGKKYRFEYSHADTNWEIETFGVWDTTP